MLIRVAEPDKPAFNLRKGEEGLSVFDSMATDPPLTEVEILENFRTGSIAVALTHDELTAKGLLIEPILGGEILPQRLRESHAEIRPGPGMSRSEFKQKLKEL